MGDDDWVFGDGECDSPLSSGSVLPAPMPADFDWPTFFADLYADMRASAERVRERVGEPVQMVVPDRMLDDMVPGWRDMDRAAVSEALMQAFEGRDWLADAGVER